LEKFSKETALLGRPVECLIHKQVEGNGMITFALGLVHNKSPPAKVNALSFGVFAVIFGEKTSNQWDI